MTRGVWGQGGAESAVRVGHPRGERRAGGSCGPDLGRRL